MIIFTLLFVFFICFSTIMGKLPSMVLALYLGASIITFVVYALDKSAAQNDRWRTRERTLHLLGLMGGWPGAMVAQKVLRHKSKKQPFQIVTFAALTVNCLALVWFLVSDRP